MSRIWKTNGGTQSKRTKEPKPYGCQILCREREREKGSDGGWNA